MATKQRKVQISERALIARINRKLTKDGDQRLKTARGFWDRNRGHWYPDSNLGRHYIIDINRNFIIGTGVDLEALGREMEVLNGWEELADG